MITIDMADNINEVIKDNNSLHKEVVVRICFENLLDEVYIHYKQSEAIITALVEATEPMSAVIYAYIDTDGVLVTACINPRSSSHVNKPIDLYVDLEKLHLFDKVT